MITPSEIELPRSPSALRNFVIQFREDVESNDSERHRGILKKGLYKQFLDEIVPLSLFVIKEYPEDFKVQPILGNQGYDALVFDGSGKEVDRIEITTPQDGAEKAIDARKVVNQGYGKMYMGKPGHDFEALFPHVLATCQRKAQKDYGDCTLVVAISPNPPSQSFEALYEDQIAALVCQMAQINFKAKRVFLLVNPDRIVKIRG